MRIAIMSDIHGVITALDAVLADIEQRGRVDEYWLLGDLVEAGPPPVAVLERIVTLPNTRVIRGNTDRYVKHSLSTRPAGKLCVTRRHLYLFGRLIFRNPLPLVLVW